MSLILPNYCFLDLTNIVLRSIIIKERHNYLVQHRQDDHVTEVTSLKCLNMITFTVFGFFGKNLTLPVH